MDQFTDRLARLSELTPEELDALEQELVTAFDAADEAGDVDTMQSVADALDQVREERQRRPEGGGETAPEAAPPAPSAQAASGEPVAETPPEPEPEPEPSPDDEPETPEETPTAEQAPEETPEGTTDETSPEVKEGATVAEVTRDEVPDRNKPLVTASSPVVIRAGGDIPGITAGTELSDMDDVVDAMTRKVNTMRGISGDGEYIVVASMRVEDDIPETRILRPGDADGNSRKIRELISDPEQLTHDALTAAGWCAPRAPIYDVPTIGTTDRPVRDSLPTFSADRGGITWMQPPALATAVSGMGLWRWNTGAAGGAAWNAYTDATGTTLASPANLKPCVPVVCGAELSAELEALTICLCFDNLMTRTFPEWVRANTDLTLVAQARFAEQYLLSKMFAVTADVNYNLDTPLGTARDILSVVRVAAGQFRWKNRIGRTAPLQFLAPTWLRDAVAGDLTLQAPGDDTISVSVETVNGYFNDLNVDPIWYIDDAPTTDAWTATDAFPATAEWLLYPTGTFTRLDGGSLDLGVVRTKEDVQKNTYCEFAETFESLAYMGPAAPNGWVIHGKTAIDLLGATACCVDTAGTP